MVEILIGVVLLLALGVDYVFGRKSAYKTGHEAGREEGQIEGHEKGKKELIRDLKLSAGEGNSSPSVAQVEKRVALAEMSRDSYKREATEKHQYHLRQVEHYKKEIKTLSAERDSLAAQVQSLTNPKPDPITGSGNQGVMY